jgi:hypothetical protein
MFDGLACKRQIVNNQTNALPHPEFWGTLAADVKHSNAGSSENPSATGIGVMIRTAGADLIAEVFFPKIPSNRTRKNEKPHQRPIVK